MTTTETPALDLSRYSTIVRQANALKMNGRVTQVVGVLVESQGPAARVGEICEIYYRRNARPILAEVVGFREDRALLMPFGDLGQVGLGSEVVATGSPLMVKVGQSLTGRVLDGLGRPLDGKGPIDYETEVSVNATPPHPLKRKRISQALSVGVRAIDGILTVGSGQRVGIFSGSGVGKSTLLGMIARNTTADVNVIALIGERGREVRDFIEKDLGEDGLRRSVVVVATSDQVAVARLRGAQVASSIAEYFRDGGLNVMLMMDSVTRVAWAQREIGLAAGEPPTTRGYTPSVFAALPSLLERSGTSDRGSITGLYTVLVEGDDMNEPVADTVRGILDGHIVLSRALASQNHYPAIDVLSSVSRLMPEVAGAAHRAAAGTLRDVLANYRSAEDMINIGAYVDGSNPKIDYARSKIDLVNGFLKQSVDDPAPYAETVDRLTAMFGENE